jgi:hypothetical protein
MMDLNHIVRPHGQSPLPRLVTPSLYLDAHGQLPGSCRIQEALWRVTSNDLTEEGQRHLGSTGSRHPSGEMATARGVRVNLSLRSRSQVGPHHAHCRTVAATDEEMVPTGLTTATRKASTETTGSVPRPASDELGSHRGALYKAILPSWLSGPKTRRHLRRHQTL